MQTDPSPVPRDPAESPPGEFVDVRRFPFPDQDGLRGQDDTLGPPTQELFQTRAPDQSGARVLDQRDVVDAQPIVRIRDRADSDFELAIGDRNAGHRELLPVGAGAGSREIVFLARRGPCIHVARCLSPAAFHPGRKAVAARGKSGDLLGLLGSVGDGSGMDQRESARARGGHVPAREGRLVRRIRPTGQGGLNHPVGVEARVQDPVVAGSHGPGSRLGVQVPLRHRVHRRRGTAEGKRTPLVVAKPVPREIRPPVAGEDHGGVRGSGNAHEESGLAHVAEVQVGGPHDGFRRVRTGDAGGGDHVGVRRVPAVQIGGAEVVPTAVLEHAVPLPTGRFEDLRRGLDRKVVRGAQRSHVEVLPPAAGGADQVGLAIVVHEDGLVAARDVDHARQSVLDVVEGELARGGAGGGEQFAVSGGSVVLGEQDVLLAGGIVGHAQAPHPTRAGKTGGIGIQDVRLEFPVHQVRGGVAGHRYEPRVRIQLGGAGRIGLRSGVVHPVPVPGGSELEDSTPLRIDGIPRGVLPELVVADGLGSSHGDRSAQKDPRQPTVYGKSTSAPGLLFHHGIVPLLQHRQVCRDGSLEATASPVGIARQSATFRGSDLQSPHGEQPRTIRSGSGARTVAVERSICPPHRGCPWRAGCPTWRNRPATTLSPGGLWWHPWPSGRKTGNPPTGPIPP